MTLALIGDRTVEIVRVFDAPRQLVFDAHSAPEHVSRWWGPRGTTMTSCEMDFRSGGSWRFVLQKTNGRTYAFRGDYREVVRPERIVQTFAIEGVPGDAIVETLTFTERDGRTTLTVTSAADSPEARDAMVRSGMADGAAQTYERLEELLRAGL